MAACRAVDSRQLKRLISESLVAAGFEFCRPTWRLERTDLTWMVEAEKARSRGWSVVVGITRRDRLPPALRYADADVQIDYLHLGEHVPIGASLSRFNDHTSYFAMVLDPSHDLLPDDERADALRFLAADLRDYSRAICTIDDLHASVRGGLFRSGFVCRDVRAGSI